MAYKKRSYKKPDYSKYMFGKPTLVKKVTKLIKKEKADTEIKFLTTTGVITQLDNTVNFVYDMSNMSVGTGFANRIGLKIRLQSILVNMFASAGNVDGLVRYQVVLDKKPQTGAVLYSSVNDSHSVLANKNMDNSTRFRVLKDAVITLSNQASPIAHRKFFINLKDVDCQFTATGVPEYNQLLLVFFGSVVGTDAGGMAWSSKLNYTDK